MIYAHSGAAAAWLAGSALLAALTVATPAAAQEVALVHEDGDRVEPSGMPVREFAYGLRMESTSGEDITFPDVCFAALVDSEGNVWEEYVSEPFRSESGELEGACVPRFPILPEGYFPEWSERVPFEEPLGSDVFFAGMVDWEFIMKRVDQSAPEYEAAYLKIGDIAGESQRSLVPPMHLEGVEYDWVAVFFLVGPSDEMALQPGQPEYGNWPIMIMVGAN